MRIAGWFLLLIGLLLCASVVWATLGFLLMGVGLVSLQAAERNRRRVRHAVAAGAERPEMPLEAVAAPWTIELALEPALRREPVLAPAREAARREDPARPRFEQRYEPRHDKSAPAQLSYDREAWHHLIERDPDLAQLAAVLADYGQPYVDELAARYLMDPDKSRLGGIVDGIIARAGRDVPVPPAGKLPAASKPWIVPVQVPEVAIPRDVQAPSAFSAPAEAPQLAENEASMIAATAAVSDQPAPVDPLGSNGESGHTAITAADDDLTDMIRQFGPAADFPRKA